MQRNLDLFVSYSNEQLERIGVPTVLIPSLREVIDLNGLQAIEKYLPEDVFENVFYLIDGLPIEEIIKEIEEGKVVAGATQKILITTKDTFLKLQIKIWNLFFLTISINGAFSCILHNVKLLTQLIRAQ
jgi:hypothetical protein